MRAGVGFDACNDAGKWHVWQSPDVKRQLELQAQEREAAAVARAQADQAAADAQANADQMAAFEQWKRDQAQLRHGAWLSGLVA